MKIEDRAKIFEEQAREIWVSLSSHLEWMYKKSEDGPKWHREAVRDYVVQLYKLKKLIDE